MFELLAFGIGTQEVLVILAIAVLLFGATKLPQLGSAVGQSIKNFKRGMREAKAEEEEALKEEQKKLSADEEKPKDKDTDASA